jgi:Ubiquinone biosynthesis protein COQ7
MNRIDRLIHGFDGLLRTIAGVKPESRQPSPARAALDDPLTDAETERSAQLMRVNHTGEICAQGLYNGQALFASDQRHREPLLRPPKRSSIIWPGVERDWMN